MAGFMLIQMDMSEFYYHHHNITHTTMNELQILQYLIERHLVADSATINTAFNLIAKIRQQLAESAKNE
jgi:hypothetical protein